MNMIKNISKVEETQFPPGVLEGQSPSIFSPLTVGFSTACPPNLDAPGATDAARRNCYSGRMSTQLPLDPKLLEILVCPVTRGPLRYDREKAELISDEASLAYPIRDGIPIMLPGEARKLEP